MNVDELENYLSNIVDELDGRLVEKPGDEYYLVEVTRMEEDADGVLHPAEEDPEIVTDGGVEDAEGVRHVEQSLPYEWAAFQWGDGTFIAYDSPDGPGVDLYVVSGFSRNVRDLARADAVLYEGNLLHPHFDEDLRTVEFCHEFGGRMGEHRVDEWLDEPAVRLGDLPRADLSEVMD